LAIDLLAFVPILNFEVSLCCCILCLYVIPPLKQKTGLIFNNQFVSIILDRYVNLCIATMLVNLVLNSFSSCVGLILFFVCYRFTNDNLTLFVVSAKGTIRCPIEFVVWM
jgi:hypothetical protein